MNQIEHTIEGMVKNYNWAVDNRYYEIADYIRGQLAKFINKQINYS